MPTIRDKWLEKCRLVTEHILPTRGHYEKSMPEDEKRAEFNDRAMQFPENMAAMFMSGITSPANPWMKLYIEDDDMMDWKPAKQCFPRGTGDKRSK